MMGCRQPEIRLTLIYYLTVLSQKIENRNNIDSFLIILYRIIDISMGNCEKCVRN